MLTYVYAQFFLLEWEQRIPYYHSQGDGKNLVHNKMCGKKDLIGFFFGIFNEL